ncbi:hypothetical protein GCM10020331_058350 [Ectobacillus funiculus]
MCRSNLTIIFTHDTVWEELYNRAQELGYEHSEQAAREMMERFFPSHFFKWTSSA